MVFQALPNSRRDTFLTLPFHHTKQSQDVTFLEQMLDKMRAAAETFSTVSITFTSPILLEWLESASADALDGLPFGAIGMEQDGSVKRCNLADCRAAEPP